MKRVAHGVGYLLRFAWERGNLPAGLFLSSEPHLSANAQEAVKKVTTAQAPKSCTPGQTPVTSVPGLFTIFWGGD